MVHNHHTWESAEAPDAEPCKSSDARKKMSILKKTEQSIKYDQLNLEKYQLLKEMKITVA